uniref:SH3 domain-containing protein n=1 Tax=Angiostrongylus cantonensis TaxID=6313 RepID=A0A0K0DQY9_ANGCA
MMILKWVENECKSDPSLSLVSTLYKNLLADGYSFTSNEPKKSDSKDIQAAVNLSLIFVVRILQEEEEALVKAIALSLQEAEAPKTSRLYQSSATQRTVRALYDFEAAEDNELSFVTGDLITVTDDSNPNWWCGRIGVQQGLFPSSFVTSDLSEVKVIFSNRHPSYFTIIDESVLLRCIQMLEDCDPTGETPDPPELAAIEQASRSQGPLINARLAAIDTQINALSEVDMAIRDVLALYDQAVQQAPMNFPPTSSQIQPVFPSSCTNPPTQAVPVANVQAQQDAQTTYSQYGPVQQTTAYQQHSQIRPEWNTVQYQAQNY